MNRSQYKKLYNHVISMIEDDDNLYKITIDYTQENLSLYIEYRYDIESISLFIRIFDSLYNNIYNVFVHKRKYPSNNLILIKDNEEQYKIFCDGSDKQIEDMARIISNRLGERNA